MEWGQVSSILLQVDETVDKIELLQNTACKLQEQINDISSVMVNIKREIQQLCASDIASDGSLSSRDTKSNTNYVDDAVKTKSRSVDSVNHFPEGKDAIRNRTNRSERSKFGEVSSEVVKPPTERKESTSVDNTIVQGTSLHVHQGVTEHSGRRRFKGKVTKPGCDNRTTFLDCEKEQSLNENLYEVHSNDVGTEDTVNSGVEVITSLSLSPRQNVSSSQQQGQPVTQSFSFSDSSSSSEVENVKNIKTSPTENAKHNVLGSNHSMESEDDFVSPLTSIDPSRIQSTEEEHLYDRELSSEDSSSTGSDVRNADLDVEDMNEDVVVDAPEVKVLEEQQLEKLTLEEASGADNCHDPKSHGADTILCVDVSDSMKGSLKDMQAFMYRFIEGIEDSAVEFSLEENIAVVTFGTETKILQNLTNDYTKVRDVIESLTLGGPSPMMTGLVFCMSAIYNRGGEVQYKDRKISPRIILLTDGKPTDQRIFNGPDVITKQGHNKKEIWRKLMEFAERIRSHGENRQLVCVPFGEKPDMEMLRQMSNTACGRIAKSTDEEALRLSRNFMLETVAARLVHEGLLKDGLPEESELRQKVQTAQEGYELTDLEVKDAVAMIKKEYERLGATAGFEEGEIDGEEREMPQIGTRVRRGPNWKWAEQDSNTVGTIIAHRDRGWLSVEWDSGYKGKYRYGAEGGAKDVRVVDEPRVLPPGMLAAVGCKATRGKDWEWGNQDGGEGAVGIIFKIEDSGVLHIRWESGKRGNYRFGLYGKFDVKICDSAKIPDDATKANKQVSGIYQQWQWMDTNGDWNDFSRASSDKIESFYKKRNGKGTVIVNADKEDVRVMVEKWTYRGISTGLEGPLRRVDEETQR